MIHWLLRKFYALLLAVWHLIVIVRMNMNIDLSGLPGYPPQQSHQVREDKRGSIPQDLPPILDRLQINPQHWCYLTKYFESPFKGLVGAAYALKQACQNLGYQLSPGMLACRQFLT
jgi:hypothetical protein